MSTRAQSGRTVTIKTIAEAAGTHPSTVSRALNPKTASMVGVETVRRVREIAAAFGYEPNPWARSLRTKKTMTVGIVLPRLTDRVLASMFEAASERARQLGYQTMAVSTKDDPVEEKTAVHLLLDRRIDGVVLATCRIDDPLPREIAARRTPVVLMNRCTDDFPVVRSDDEVGGYLATRHLLALGHRRIGLVAGRLDVSTAKLRLEGYRRAHKEYRCRVDERLIAESSFLADGGISAGTQLLTAVDRPTAIVAVNDAAAVGVMAVARDLGLSIPRDLSIVGHNDDELAQMLPVPLTTIHVQLTEIGRICMEKVVGIIGGDAPESAILPPSLVVRASTAPVRG